jgi:hypothetical protein
MEFTGTINQAGLNTFIDASTVVLRLENGTDIEIIVSKFMAKTLAHKLYQKVTLTTQDPILGDGGKATATFINKITTPLAGPEGIAMEEKERVGIDNIYAHVSESLGT